MIEFGLIPNQLLNKELLNNGYKYSGYLDITEKDNLYHIKFIYKVLYKHLYKNLVQVFEILYHTN